MADEPEDLVVETEELTEELEQQPEEQEEFSIEIDGEEVAEEPDLVKNLRHEIRERDRRLATYERSVQPKIEVGVEPDLWENCEGDDVRFKAEYAAWLQRKAMAESQEAETRKAAEAQSQAHQAQTINYRAKLAALPLPEADKQAAEDVVRATLPEILQSAIIAYANDPAKVVVALAKHPARLEALSKEQDPIKFIIAMRELEGNLKVVTRKRPPEAESNTVQRGSAPLAVGADKHLARLEAEAEVSGDRTKVQKYKREHRQAA